MDLGILHWVNNTLHTNELVTDIFLFISKISDTGFLWIVLSLVLLIFKNTRKIGLYSIISLAACFIVTNVILKNVIARPRPFEESESILSFLNSICIELPDSHSFPSGHTAASFAVAFMIWLFNKRHGTPSIIMAVLVGISRIYLCVHYVTDVIAGMMIGIIVAFVAYWVLEHILNKYECNKYGYKKVKPLINRS